MTEIDQLIQKSYEDMTKGLSKERFSTLTVSLETEQTQLKAAIPEMEAILDATAADFQRFIERARQVTRLTELTPEIVHEFIEKIVVSKPEKLDGKRHRQWISTTIPLACGQNPTRKRWNRNRWLITEPCGSARKRRHSNCHAVLIK